MRCEGFTEVNETVGYGQTGPAKGLAFHPGTNSVILVALDQEHVAQVTKLVKAWYEEAAKPCRLGETCPSRLLLAKRADCLAAARMFSLPFRNPAKSFVL